MREYELTVLVHPDLEMHLETATDKVKALIEANGGLLLLRTGTSCNCNGEDFFRAQHYGRSYPLLASYQGSTS